MRPFSVLMFITIGLLLITRHPAISERLPQPTLFLYTNDPDDVIMEGDTISIFCETKYRNAKKFFLTCLSTNETIEQKGSHFSLSQITSGAHTCKYCDGASCSEPSDPEHIYVRDALPEPIISVTPSKIVHFGDRITITCSAHYENVIFSLYKGNKLVKEAAASTNTTSYEIQNIGRENAGQYMCWYKKTTNNRLIQSHPSDPLMIRIKDLPKPTVSLEFPEGDSGSVIIHCAAPRTDSRMWFQLLRENKIVEQEKEDTQENKATFTIKDLNEKYNCIYRIRIGTDFADSKLSDVVFLGKGDHTTGNIIRLIFAAVVLIATGLILRKHLSEDQNLEEPAPDLPAARVLLVKESVEMEIQMQHEPAKENEYKSI
ncbi:Ig-like receptor 2 S homeolog precursor [Xenopus laevis]|uniref:Ig-like receptor 2 S homeolog precursor n=2 Tax=Xenopus laevis TaxID=8355 RepID=B1NA54_XENLA|nr:Ig-like receptor 2 S homeolog precursor [Xenopus laevis]ABR19641.1 Ig-like receptor 2.1 [Xenopus laevis]OCT70884.1 hypothetical protein XELAEV_18037809mg [Xenopus laevis]